MRAFLCVQQPERLKASLERSLNFSEGTPTQKRSNGTTKTKSISSDSTKSSRRDKKENSIEISSQCC